MRTPDATRKALIRLGFRIPPLDSTALKQAIKTFQTAYALGPKLKADGVNGPLTDTAITRSLDNSGKVSPHFRFKEFACKCDGARGCRGVVIDRLLLEALEALKATHYKNTPLKITSAYRCEFHNRAVGGAKNSQHLKGRAADINAKALRNSPWPKTIKGIGYRKSDHKVIHVDARRTVSRVTWVYSNR